MNTMLLEVGLPPQAGTIQAYCGSVVFATLRLFPSAKQSKQLAGILSSVRDLTLTQSECLGCWLDDGGYLHGPISYIEQWGSEEALHQHLRSDLYAWLLAAMELSEQPPEVYFHRVSDSEGMGLIEQMRGVSGAKSVAGN